MKVVLGQERHAIQDNDVRVTFERNGHRVVQLSVDFPGSASRRGDGTRPSTVFQMTKLVLSHKTKDELDCRTLFSRQPPPTSSPTCASSQQSSHAHTAIEKRRAVRRISSRRPFRPLLPSFRLDHGRDQFDDIAFVLCQMGKPIDPRLPRF